MSLRKCVQPTFPKKVCCDYRCTSHMFTAFTVQWTDIDLYHAYRDFTTDPVSFPPEEVRKFVEDLVSDTPRTIDVQGSDRGPSHRARTTNIVSDAFIYKRSLAFQSSSPDIPIVDAAISVTDNSTDVVC